MPTSYEILQGLETISNRMGLLAIAWHVVLGGGILAYIAGWRPSIRFTRVVLSLPLISVSAAAWIYGNPFNGSVFLLFGFLLLIFGMKTARDNITVGLGWDGIFGIIVIIFGMVYPHFLHTSTWVPYLYRSPLGLIPCPTLSVVTGAALTIEDLKSRGWYITVIVAGLFYGIIGVVRLGVNLDLVLIVASILLMAKMAIGLKK